MATSTTWQQRLSLAQFPNFHVDADISLTNKWMDTKLLRYTKEKGKKPEIAHLPFYYLYKIFTGSIVKTTTRKSAIIECNVFFPQWQNQNSKTNKTKVNVLPNNVSKKIKNKKIVAPLSSSQHVQLGMKRFHFINHNTEHMPKLRECVLSSSQATFLQHFLSKINAQQREVVTSHTCSLPNRGLKVAWSQCWIETWPAER